MISSTIGRAFRLSVLCASGLLALNSNAEIFYAGDTKGLPGEAVELSINARAGTLLEAIDIVPKLAPVASVLSFMSLDETPGLTVGGSGLCSDTSCAFFFFPEKTFAADTVLATVRFNIDAGAAPGPVPFDPGVTVGVAPLPIPVDANFEVLAVPEPSTWAMLVAGLLVVAAALRRRKGANA